MKITNLKLDLIIGAGSGAIRKETIFEYQNELIKQFETNLNGTITSFAAISGYELDELPAVLERISQNALLALEEAPKHFEKKHNHATDRYQFVGEDKIG